MARRGRRAASGVAAGALMAFATIAVLVLHASQRRTELVYRGSIDSMQNPAAGSGKGGWGAAEADFYTGENSDAPGTPSSWQWVRACIFSETNVCANTGKRLMHAPQACSHARFKAPL